MSLEVEEARLIIRAGPRRFIGVPTYLNMLGSVKMAPARYLAGIARAEGRPLYVEDPRLRRALEAICGECAAAKASDGRLVSRAEVVEAYYNTLAPQLLSLAPSIDSIVVPCYTGALGEAIAKRAEESTPGVVLVAARLGEGGCGWANAVYAAQEIDGRLKSLNLGPASLAALSAALKAAEELNLYSTLVVLTDGK